MSETPQRIQRKRSKGWRMLDNTIYVGRPTKWGNPFVMYRDSMELYSNVARGVWDPRVIADLNDGIAREIYRAHHAWLERIGRHPSEVARSELSGRNLACWCPLHAACHADVLLKIANE